VLVLAGWVWGATATRIERSPLLGRDPVGLARPIAAHFVQAGVKIVREKSVAGPCITLGVVLRETTLRITYRDRHGEQKFISKRWPVHSGPAHHVLIIQGEIPGSLTCGSKVDAPRIKLRRFHMRSDMIRMFPHGHNFPHMLCSEHTPYQ
jgi:hypothetical protein